MALGPHIPEWAELHERLGALAASVDATAVCVLDAWGLPWCCGPVHDVLVARDACHVLRRAVRSLERDLEQGGSIDRAVGADDNGAAYVRSFAGVYVLVVRFEGLFNLARAKAAVATALPAIEALVVALPPPRGPGSGSAEALGRA